ncbi:hypothetical protein GCM10011415_26970 [Salipiger pallidus]|uniref:Integral membrane bound transporter domain-containing protein n=1 Tax=Salipiger pallidus TaxID=1775170 RepID=A0A8J2ZKU5_9RHOB|nr:hypothetical protein GCM10011415_26970 [Salipiger pallidus]
MMLAVPVAPLIAVSIFGPVGMAAFAAAMPAHLASKEGGAPVALLATLTTGLGGMVAIGNPVMALMVAGCLAVMTAIAAHHRLARPAMRAVLTWCLFTSPLLPSDDLPLLFALYLAGMIWSIAVTAIASRIKEPEAQGRQSRTYSFTFGAVFGIGLVATVWAGQHFFGEHGFWLPLTFVIMALPPYGGILGRSIKRVLATVLGTLMALGVSALALPSFGVIALALAAFPLAFRFIPRSNFTGVTLLTFTIVEGLSLISDIDMLALDRVETAILASVMTFGLWLLASGALLLLKPKAMREAMGEDS